MSDGAYKEKVAQVTLTERMAKTDQRHLPDNVVPMNLPERRVKPRWMELRDADRVLAHSLADEVYERPEPDLYVFRWADVAKFIVGMALLYGLVIALVIMGTVAT